MEPIFFCYIFAILVVIFFSKDYFTNYTCAFFDSNKKEFDDSDTIVEPAIPKLLTTRFQFILSLSLFVLSTLAVFWVIGQILPFLLPDEMAEKLTQETKVITSALIISGLIPNFPYINKLIDKFRDFFYGLVKIPEKAQSIYYVLKSTPIEFSEEKIRALLDDKQFKNKISEEEFDYTSSEIEKKWAHITYLMYIVQLWSKDINFKRYILDSGLHWNEICETYESYLDDVVKYKHGKFNNEEISRLHGRLDILILKIYRLVCCLLVMSAKNESEYAVYLEELGYRHEPLPVFTLSMNRILFLIVFCAVGIFFGAFFSTLVSWLLNQKLQLPPVHHNAMEHIKYYLLYGVPFITLPVVIILILKKFMSDWDVWPTVTKDRLYIKVSERPWLIYFFISLISYIAGLAILLSLSVILDQDLTLKEALRGSNILKHTAWPLVCFNIALFISYRCDTPYFVNEHAFHIKILSALGKAFLLGLFVSLTVIFCYFIGSSDVELFELAELSPENLGRLVSYSTMGFFIGFTLFFTTRSQAIIDRRKYQRIKSNTSLFVVLENQKFPAKMKNISRGGAFIKVKRISSAGVGETLELEFKGNRILKGKIVEFSKGKLRMGFQNEISYSDLRHLLCSKIQKKLSLKYAC
jgi:hypothetical protein